jgi:ferredoxin-type protein NapH
VAKTKTRQKARKAILLFFFILFPVIINYLSPYLSMSAAAEGIISGSLLFFGLLFLSSLLLGRAYCGWVCPGGATQELCMSVNDRRVRRRRLDWIKYVVWAPWFTTILFPCCSLSTRWRPSSPSIRLRGTSSTTSFSA